MFEKEAEDNKPPYAYCALDTKCELWKDGFQKGAEFGYNKAKEDADKMKSQFLELCNLKDMRIAELEKADEWHYVKDGKYPKEKQLVMVYRINPLGANIAITNWYDSYKDTKVIAWKEIVLPELKENE